VSGRQDREQSPTTETTTERASPVAFSADVLAYMLADIQRDDDDDDDLTQQVLSRQQPERKCRMFRNMQFPLISRAGNNCLFLLVNFFQN